MVEIIVDLVMDGMEFKIVFINSHNYCLMGFTEVLLEMGKQKKKERSLHK